MGERPGARTCDIVDGNKERGGWTGEEVKVDGLFEDVSNDFGMGRVGESLPCCRLAR